MAADGVDVRKPRVVLGVAGGIAAYKAADLLRRLTESGHDVRVVPTASALRFVGAPTWAALSGHPVATDVWDDVHEVPHVRIGQEADPSSSPPPSPTCWPGRARLADDLLTTTLLTACCPVVMAPAMHTEMAAPRHRRERRHAAERVEVLEPASGRLTGADIGPGRPPEPAEPAAAMRPWPARPQPATWPGGTSSPRRRHLRAPGPGALPGNRSSGRQGWALASTAAARGARVTLVAANVALPQPSEVTVVPVVSAEELRAAVLTAAADADAVVMAAAVADFRPRDTQDTKIKKGAGEPDSVALVRTADVLAEVARAPRARAGQVVVGFAAETGDAEGDALAHGRAKLATKGADLLVVNEVGGPRAPHRVRGRAERRRGPGRRRLADRRTLGPKEALADTVWDLVRALDRPQTVGLSRPTLPHPARRPVSRRLFTRSPSPRATRQDRRPDQRLDPGRPPHRGPQEPGAVET
jgi:phosphopantothenoylcysteine decarboxylase/phosphopantothenate--cysteine ligase